MDQNPIILTSQQQIIKSLSDRIVNAQRPIRVLDALKWGYDIQIDFFQSPGKKLPVVDKNYYSQFPLAFDPLAKTEEFYAIEKDIRSQLGNFSGVSSIMQRMCREYRGVIRLLQARGTPEFSKISQELYGSASDAFYAAGPSLNDLAIRVMQVINQLGVETETIADDKVYSAEEAVVILSERLGKYFNNPLHQIHVKISDDIVADAAAGAETIKLRSAARFSERDLRILEVHEGWVHLGTTINGMQQPICTFLSKGPPSSTINQEGLAMLTEIFTFSSSPQRVKWLTDRVTVIHMAEQGANFLDVYHYYHDNGADEVTSYTNTARIFRGSTPEGGPFTKDLAYTKGFVQVYNYIRLAIQKGLLSRIPLLFLGKTTLEDVHVLEDLIAEGIVIPPKYVPPQFCDLAGLSAWLCYSLFLGELNLQQLNQDYKSFLQQ